MKRESEKRTEQITFLATKEQREKLELHARAFDISVSDVLRTLIDNFVYGEWKMYRLIYCTLDTPSERIKSLYRTLHQHDIPHEVKQNEKNNSVYTIRAMATKRTAPILKELGFEKYDDKGE